MRVIFLDFDGVLNSATYLARVGGEGMVIDPVPMALLQKIVKAKQVAMFTAMYEQYSINPEITRSRMYYEAISQILPDVKLFVNTSGGEDVQMLLPLDALLGNPTAEQP